METELKLSPVSAEQAQRVFSDLAPRLGAETRIRMETVWYDTEDGALAACGWTARIRREDGVPVCTLKGPTVGLSRVELEAPAATVAEGVAALSARAELSAEARAALARPLLERGGARFTRRVARYDDGALAFDLSYDAGVLLWGGQQGALCEMELELRVGTEQALRAFGAELALTHGLPLCTAGKLRRARALGEAPVRDVSPFFAASELLNYCIRCGYISFRMDGDNSVHYGLTALGAQELPRRFGVDFDKPCAEPEDAR